MEWASPLPEGRGSLMSLTEHFAQPWSSIWPYLYSQLCTEHKHYSVLLQTCCLDGLHVSKRSMSEACISVSSEECFLELFKWQGILCPKVRSDFITEFDFLLANKCGYKTSAFDDQWASRKQWGLHSLVPIRKMALWDAFLMTIHIFHRIFISHRTAGRSFYKNS